MVRAAIALQLFKKTSNVEYINQARSLIEKNKQANQDLISSLLTRHDAFPPNQRSISNSMILDFILDEEFNSQFRTELLTVVLQWSDNMRKAIEPSKVERVTKYAGLALVETVSASTTFCYQITHLLEILDKLSQEAALVYAHRALENPGGTESERQCIKKELDKAVGIRQPTLEMIQRWAVQ